jgi:hypothetical protein
MGRNISIWAPLRGSRAPRLTRFIGVVVVLTFGVEAALASGFATTSRVSAEQLADLIPPSSSAMSAASANALTTTQSFGTAVNPSSAQQLPPTPADIGQKQPQPHLELDPTLPPAPTTTAAAQTKAPAAQRQPAVPLTQPDCQKFCVSGVI